jgi:hypothetical protein
MLERLGLENGTKMMCNSIPHEDNEEEMSQSSIAR